MKNLVKTCIADFVSVSNEADETAMDIWVCILDNASMVKVCAQ